MAEGLRQQDSDEGALADQQRMEIAVEAMRQSESALYTSTTLYIWLRQVRIQQQVVTLAPVILTGIAGFSFAQEWLPAWALAVLALLATLIPSLAEKLEIETRAEELKRSAAEYKSLQDRFRVLAKIGARGAVHTAQQELTALLDRMDVVRSSSVTPPEKYFEKAREKISAGHYDFSADLSLSATTGAGADPILHSPHPAGRATAGGSF